MKPNEWRAKRRITVELPSGLTVTLRRVTIQALTQSGKIPKPLLVGLKSLGGEVNVSVSMVDSLIENYDKLPLVNELMDIVVRACIVYPKIVDDESLQDDDHFFYADLDDEDRNRIYNLVTEAAATAMTPFPGEHPGSHDLGHAGATVSDAPVSDNGNSE